MRTISTIGANAFVRKWLVVHMQVGGWLISYNLQLVCVRKLGIIWSDAHCRVDRSNWQSLLTQSLTREGIELLGQLKTKTSFLLLRTTLNNFQGHYTLKIIIGPNTFLRVSGFSFLSSLTQLSTPPNHGFFSSHGVFSGVDYFEFFSSCSSRTSALLPSRGGVQPHSQRMWFRASPFLTLLSYQNCKKSQDEQSKT